MKAAVAVVLLFVAELLYGQCAVVPVEGTAGAPITFDARECNGATSAVWSFGDGTQASGSVAVHTFAATGTYTWTVQTSQFLEASGRIAINSIAGGQCSFCPLNVPSGGDMVDPVVFGMCPGAPSHFWTFGDGQDSKNYTGSPDLGDKVLHWYSAPGVYAWTAKLTSTDGQVCERSGQITIIGCQVTSLSIDTTKQVSTGSVTLNWTTNNSPDCHPTGNVKSVTFAIYADWWAFAPIDGVPDTVSSRTLSLSSFAREGQESLLPGLGRHVLAVRPIVCTTCSPCDLLECFPAWPGYGVRPNEQPITVLGDPNCSPVMLNVQTTSHTVTSEPLILSASSPETDLRYDWYAMSGPNDEGADDLSSYPYTSGSVQVVGRVPSGFYWVVATSPCGQWARSDLIAICALPRITVQPRSGFVPGQPLTLVAKANGAGLAFTWYTKIDGGWLPASGTASDVTGHYGDGVATTTSTLHTVPLTAGQSFYAEGRDLCGNVVDTDVVTVVPDRRRSVSH